MVGEALNNSADFSRYVETGLHRTPARRKQAQTLADVRAIPRVFAWTQNHHVVTRWY